MTDQQLSQLLSALQSGSSEGSSVPYIMAAALAIWLIKEIVFPLVKYYAPRSRNEREGDAKAQQAATKLDELAACACEISDKQRQLFALHDVKDNDGNYVWYSSGHLKNLVEHTHSLASSVKRMAESAERSAAEHQKAYESTGNSLAKVADAMTAIHNDTQVIRAQVNNIMKS